ncbi:MAG TPA: glycosyltransferase [Cellvibrionaceae bacterium]|nr:glycosyltransferase [Cellvibrionaceae bacterium]
MVKLEPPLRVLHIVSGDLWAGAEAQVFTLLSHLQALASPKVVVLNPGELADRLRELNIPMVVLPEALMSSAQITWQLLKIIYQFKPQVVHTHRQKENILGGFAFAINRLLGRAGVSVRTVHGASEFAPRGLGRLQEYLNIVVGRYIQAQLVAVSEDLRAKLLDTFKPHKLTLVRNGVDEASLHALLEAGIPKQAGFHVGIVGRLEAVKRVDLFLAMAAELIALAPQEPWQFHVIGDGRLAAQLKAQVTSLGIFDRVQFHGQVNPVAPLLAQLDMIVMCSDHEGTPMVALEALALGIPLLAHRVGGLAELLADCEPLLVSDHSPRGYADKLLAYRQAPTAPVHLPAEYTARCNAESMMALYNRLLGAA